MARQAAPALVAAMKNRPPPSEDKLDKIRDAIRRARDLYLVKSELEQRLSEVSAQITMIEQQELPDIMDQAQVPSLSIAADGNLPGYEAKSQPYFRANIEAKWTEEKRQAGFAYLEECGAGDLVKTEFTIAVSRQERKLAQRIEAGLKKIGVDYEAKLSTPWSTLTAWLKEQVQEKQTIPDLDKIGGTVGRIVKLKPIDNK